MANEVSFSPIPCLVVPVFSLSAQGSHQNSKLAARWGGKKSYTKQPWNDLEEVLKKHTSSQCRRLFFFSNKFFFNFIVFLNFTILYWFCQISKWIRHRYTCVPHPEPSSLLPPHTIPLGRPSAPAPSIQYRTSNLDWQLVSYMIFYMFFYFNNFFLNIF